jgi:hypothetical protein
MHAYFLYKVLYVASSGKTTSKWARFPAGPL